MSLRLRARAKRERKARSINMAYIGFLRSLTFPVRHPQLWLMARYYHVFFRLYYAGATEAAFHFARIWPCGLEVVTDLLRARADRPGGAP